MAPSLKRSVIVCMLLLCGITVKAQNDSRAVDPIIERIKVILEEYNSQGPTADTSEYISDTYMADDINLQIASSMGACNEIIKLYARGADVNNFVGWTATPLHYAVTSGKWEAVEILLLLGADPNSIDAFGNTPLIAAVRSGSLEIAEKLIRYGASLTATDKNKSSALHHATALDFLTIADMLLYYETPTELNDNEGNTPLMTGVSFGFYDIVDLLLQNAADPNATDKKGFTPLMVAAQNGDTLMMRLLMNSGANLYSVNAEGLNALGATVISRNKDAVLFLLDNGNRWQYEERTKSDPMALAKTYGGRDITQVLINRGMEGKRGLSLDKFSVSAGGMFTTHYQMATASLSIADPALRSGITLGTAFNPLSQRMLIDRDEEAIYQYSVTTSVIYAGIFREFPLNEPYNKNRWSLITTLSAGYRFHSLYEGTNDRPEDKFCIIPAVEVNWTRKSLSFSPGLIYLNTPFYKVAPVWFKFKLSYTLSKDSRGFTVKKIKLYNYE
ncbi:MAG: ankyrin repeat domain-containing protein [Bacteroidales bacterium]|nr:ankyrin repeat domain-containing protein [Bacteroidales bacterium]